MPESPAGSPPYEPSPAARLMSAWWNLGQTIKRCVVPTLEREHGMDFKDFLVLEGIDRGARYPSLLAERMGVPPSHVSRLLDEHARKGLLRRSLDPLDSRRVRLEITERGELALRATRATVVGLLERATADLPPERVAALADALLRMSATLAEAGDHEPDRLPADAPAS